MRNRFHQRHRAILPRRAALSTGLRGAACVAVLGLGPLLTGCALMPDAERVRVSVASVDSLPGQGLELRFLLRLRVQNPGETAVDYDGVFVELDLQGRSFATGVTDVKGSVPRFSEQLVDVPLTVSALGALRQILGLAAAGPWPDKLNYELRGRIGGPAFSGLRFQSRGELSLGAAQR